MFDRFFVFGATLGAIDQSYSLLKDSFRTFTHKRDSMTQRWFERLFSIYDLLRNNFYIKRFELPSLDENMLLLLSIVAGFLLVPGVTIFLLYYLCARRFEEIKGRELQRLVTECLEGRIPANQYFIKPKKP